MKKISLNNLLILSIMACNLCLIVFSAIAQQLPKHNNFQELGLSFDIPNGWQGQLSESSVLLGHSTISGLMLLTENQSKNALQLKALAMEGMTDNGVQLTPSDEFIIVGKTRVEGFYQGYFNGADVKVYAIGLINGLGNGMNIIVMTETNRFTQQHVIEANKMAASVNFYQSKDYYATTNWKQKIIGTQLKYMNTSGFSDYGGSYNSTSDKVFIELCTNSTFYYYSNYSASFDSSSGSDYVGSSDNSNGSYKINSSGKQSYLSLNFNNGEIYEYALTSNNQGNTFLDDSRYLITQLESCN